MTLVTRVSTNPLPGINVSWHDRCIDVLSLQRTKCFNSGVYEIQYNGVPCVAKIARFGWDIPRIEHETWVYSILAGYQKNHPNEPIAPAFLGHLTENDRVMGFLLQKVDGERACIDDLADRTALLNRLYSLDFVHGDVNRHNFLVGRVSGGGVHLIDFEHVALFQEGLAEKELLSLPVELTEETGRGSTV